MKVGDYVRTKEEGIIGKIIEQNEQYVIVPYKNNELFVSKDNIKSSSKIIDLIEVGDYVNGKEVINCKEKWIQLYDKRTIDDCEIKSIVTKEQFESIKYEVN